MPACAGGLHGLDHQVGRGGRQRGEDAAAVEPAHALVAEEPRPIHVAGLHLRGGRVGPIRAAHRGAHAVALLGEVQPHATVPANAVERPPNHVRQVHAALEHQVFQQVADFAIGNGRDHRRPQSEAAAQAAGDVVFAAALPNLELAGGADASVARVQPQHDFAQRQGVPAAGRAGLMESVILQFSSNGSDHVGYASA